jgi:hypothetical protein
MLIVSTMTTEIFIPLLCARAPSKGPMGHYIDGSKRDPTMSEKPWICVMCHQLEAVGRVQHVIKTVQTFSNVGL